MIKTEREEIFVALTDHVLLSDSEKVMVIMERIVHDPETNIFDKTALVRELTEAWQATRHDIVIPANPENAPYVLVHIANPFRHYMFFTNREHGIEMRNANMRAGVPTRLIDCATATIIVE